MSRKDENEKASQVRTVVTVLVIAIGLAFAWAVFQTGGPSPQSHSPNAQNVTDDAQQSDIPALVATTAVSPDTQPSATKPQESTDPPQAAVEAGPLPIDGLHAKPAAQAQISTVGALKPDQGYVLEAQLTGWGAAVRYIRLVRYTKTPLGDSPFEVQSPIEAQDVNGQTIRLYPFASKTITVNGTPIYLEDKRWSLAEPGVYWIELADGQDHPVVRITRHYRVQKDYAPYDLRCDQSILNLSDQPLRVIWSQYAQGDVVNDDAAYLGDRRTFVAGYYNLDYNPNRQFVYTENAYLTRASVLDGQPLWHGNSDLPHQSQLVWVAAVNRYFAAAVHPVAAGSAGVTDVIRPLDEMFPTLGLQVIGNTGHDKDDRRAMAFTLTSQPIDIPAGKQTALDLSLYAGPRDSDVFANEPYQSLGFSKLIVYELGCAMCTFQPLAKGLLSFLKGIHYVVGDWGVAIIFLVLCVRLVLHPITKRAQVNMFKMSKQMQAMQPEIEKLKKKYKDDQQKFQQEQLKLWREKGINPVNMLGCLPMFLQTPIWVALYAMLYLAIELRHQPAFYGIFQKISGDRWHFLADLSSPDNFIQFAGQGYTLNLFFIHPTFAGIHLLPILMAVVFYFQQKLTTPPPANEQAAQQQKMMKFMVLLFPIMLYSAPSGLTLYILASTFAGIIDSYVVRQHVNKQEESGTLFTKSPSKSGGWMGRMQAAIEAKQREMSDRQTRQATGRTSKRRRRS